jgi:hypothetical protein
MGEYCRTKIFIKVIFLSLYCDDMSNNSYTELQILRGDSASSAAFVGRAGVLTLDTETTEDTGYGILRAHTGDQTPGGYIIAGAGGGGGGTYTNAAQVPTTLGGIIAGSTFLNVPITEMFDRLLYPYQAPTFTAFTISGQATTLEVGDSITAGTKTFNWSTSNETNISANSISILDFTNNTIIASGLSNTGTATGDIVAVTKTSATSHIYRITGSNTQNAGFLRDFTANWRWRMYWGTGSFASATENDIEGLISSSLVANSTGTFNFGAGGYKYIAYPTVFGLKSTFKDVNTGFDVDMQSAVTTEVTNSFGVGTNYFVHRSTNILGGALTITVT